ncbi:ribonuclease D-like isoform X2 [Zophobas morio]|uniref:ribonuclease D-like isoform X2 n=1 Tax=Zophobas morio TaxID=2755281 RepID=UPI0030831D20
MHSSYNDKLLIQKYVGFSPKILDTQVAAGFCGYTFYVSLAQLVEDCISLKLPKTLTLSDWSRRPLTPEQIEYAIDDVRHLKAVWDVLRQKLISMGRLDWFEEEMSRLNNLDHYDESLDECWISIKEAQNLEPKYVTRVKALAQWRESTARVTSTHPSRIMKDSTLVALCLQEIRSPPDILAVQGLSAPTIAKHSEAITNVLSAAQNTPTADYVQFPEHRKQKKENIRLVSLLSLALPSFLDKHGINRDLLVDQQELNLIANLAEEELCCQKLRVFDSWRKELVGDTLLSIKRGKAVSFSWNVSKKVLEGSTS